MKCIRCNLNEGAKDLDYLCSSCYFEKLDVKRIKRVDVDYCRRCGSYKLGSWVHTDRPLFYIKDFFEEVYKKISNITVKGSELVEAGGKFVFSVKLRVKKNVFSEEYPVIVKVNNVVCPDCVNPDNWNGKIQFRGPAVSFDDLKKIIKRWLFDVTKIESKGGGWDIYFRERPAAVLAANLLNKRFGLRMSETSEQYSWNKAKSRPKYRSVILVKK